MPAWRKIGNLFCPDNNYPWMVSHAANPVAFPLESRPGCVRVFFSCRNASQKSSVAWADFDFSDNYKLLEICSAPVLEKGTPGYFDDDGVSMSWIIKNGEKYFLYYLGWNLRVTAPWLNTIGLAVSDSINGPFVKASRAPIMDRHHLDPFTVSYPCVIKDGGLFKMWYGSNLSWGTEQHEMAHVIKYAESNDGIHWNRTGDIHIPLVHPGEYAISKPCVLKRANGYVMYYSYRASERSDKYRIGYAESSDGKNWTRMDDKAGIDVSADGWDSVSVEYPNVFDYEGNTYMLYNGNDYGKTGFGLAILEK